MFVNLGEQGWVNLEQIEGMQLIDLEGVWYWNFLGNKVDAKISFRTKEEAIEWFKENIEPAINDYNNAKFAPVDLNHLYDISQNIEAIAVILEESFREKKNSVLDKIAYGG